MTGIISGIRAIWKMMDAYSDDLGERTTMFATGEVTSGGNMRKEAGVWYREKYPNGKLLTTLRNGQVLTVVGFVLVVVLLAI